MEEKGKGAETQVLEMTPDALSAISKAVTETLVPEVEKMVTKRFEDQKQELQADLEKAEKVIKKNFGEQALPQEESKEVRLIKAAIALANGDRETLTKYNKAALEARTKAGYANSSTSADGGYIVADPAFEAEIEKIVDNYGVALRDATIVNTDRASIKTNRRGSNVTMYETAAGARKTGTKLTIEQVTVELRKFAAIAIAVDELVEDAAIDFWNEVTQGFAEEAARIIDELVFTDDDATYPGIVHTPGVNVVSAGNAITDLDWDDLMNAEAKVPASERRNAKFYMHQTVFNILRQKKDNEGRYLVMPNGLNGSIATPWGAPIELTDALPNSSVVGDSNEGYVVYGNLKRVKVYRKRGLELARSNEATVYDADGTETDLFAQDMSALRAVMRVASLVKYPEVFTVIGTGTVS